MKTPTFSHQKITGYDDQPIRKLLARLDKLAAEQAEIMRLQPQWEADAAKLAAEMNPLAADPKKADLLLMLRTKVSMCGPRLQELESQIRALEDELEVEFRERLEPAVQELVRAEWERVRTAVAAELRPHVASDSSARYQAAASPRLQAAGATLKWHVASSEPVDQSARRALARLDLFTEFGDLEKAALAAAPAEGKSQEAEVAT